MKSRLTFLIEYGHDKNMQEDHKNIALVTKEVPKKTIYSVMIYFLGLIREIPYFMILDELDWIIL